MQNMTWAFGIIILVIGVLGFIPTTAPNGLLFGLLLFDAMGSLIYIATGALAIAATRQSSSRRRLYFKVFGIIFAVITVLGFIEGNSVLGLMAVNTLDNVLNLVIALIALWAGFGSKEQAM